MILKYHTLCEHDGNKYLIITKLEVRGLGSEGLEAGHGLVCRQGYFESQTPPARIPSLYLGDVKGSGGGGLCWVKESLDEFSNTLVA